MTELVRSWDEASTGALYAGHARHRRANVDLFAALLVGTADTVCGACGGRGALTSGMPHVMKGHG